MDDDDARARAHLGLFYDQDDDLIAGVDYEEAACDNCGRSDRHTPTELAVCIDSVLGPPRTEDE